MNYEAREFYRDEKVARDYDEQFRSSLSPGNLRARLIDLGERRAFRRLLRRTPGPGKVLDLACGTGRYTELLLEYGYEVGGVDVSAEMLAIAGRRVRNHPKLLFLREGDAESLPFEPGEFDGATCMRLYHRVPPSARAKMLAAAGRVARRWGIFFYGISSPWLDARRRLRRMVLGRDSTPFPVTIERMLAELEDTGWRAREKAWVLPGLADGLVVLCERR